MSSALVSVVIPAYNAERTLLQTLDSVLGQTVRELEIIVVDDGSMDSTSTVAASSGDPRIRVVRQANAGHAGARNSGVAVARGRYVAFLDSDNVWVPDKLERQLSWLEAHPGARAVQAGAFFVDDDLGILHAEPCRRSTDPLRDALLMRNLPDIMSTLVLERDLFIELGGFDPSLPILQDWDFAIRLARVDQLHSTAAPLSGYRVHAGSQSRNVQLHVAAGKRVLGKTFDDPTLPAYALALRGRAYAHLYLMLCGGEMRYGSPVRGIAWGLRALTTDPRTLLPIVATPARARRRRRSAHRIGGQPVLQPRSQIRVLHLISGSEALEYFQLMLAHSNRRRFAIHVGSLEPTGRLQDGLAKHGIPTLSLSATSRRDYPRAIVQLVRWLRRHEIDVVQLHLLEASFVGAVAARLARTRLVVFSGHHSHEVPLHHRRSLLQADRILARWLCDRVIAPSEQMKRTFIEVHGCRPERVQVIHHGLDLEQFDPERADGRRFRAEQGLDGQLVIGAVSRYFWVKNLEALLRAFAQLEGEPHLVIVGAAGDQTSLRALATQLGVADHVRILGLRRDMAHVLAACDVFVHPALAESFGFVILEAMAMARPVVATRVGIAEEAITDGVTGVLAEGNDPDAIRQAIDRMLTMRDRWPEMGVRARSRARDFTPDKWVRNHELSFEAWLAEKGYA